MKRTGLVSVIGVTNGSGSLVDQVVYDGFGNILSETSPTNGGSLMFQGMYLERTTAQYVTNGRDDYNPSTGSWTTPDQLGFGGGLTNWYDFVGNDSTNLKDPSGETEVTWNGSWTFKGGIGVIGGVNFGGSFIFIGKDDKGNTYALSGKGKCGGETGGLCAGYVKITFDVEDFVVDETGYFRRTR